MSENIRCGAVINLAAIERNLERIRSRLSGGADYIAVIKGNAYGHGVEGILPLLREKGVKRFGVAIWEEGAQLRNLGARDEEILVLGDTVDDQLSKLVEYRLTPPIFSVETAQKLNLAAKAAGVIQPISIAVDTGMSRIGFPAGEACLEGVKQISAMENLKITGIFSHFMCADLADQTITDSQFGKYTRTVELIRAAGIELPLLHMANSCAIVYRPDTHLDAVRSGDLLMGLDPMQNGEWDSFGFEQSFSLLSRVALVKTIAKGTGVGYGNTFVAQRDTVVATVPVGFVDGYSRKLSNKGHVWINGAYAPIIGRVCMDQFMADITDIPGVKRGDLVELIGPHVTVSSLADVLDTCPDDIVCAVSYRVPRLYTYDGLPEAFR